MRLAWPPPWHLTASALLCVIALALANLTPAEWQQRASIPAAVLVALVAGHLVVLSAYPAHGLDMKRRAVLIILVSALLAGILSALLTATPRGLQPSSLATTLSLLSLLLAAVAYGRWSAQPRKRRFRFLSRRGMRPAGVWPSGRRAAFSVVIAAAFLAAAIALLSGLVHNPEMSEGSGADLGSEGVSLQAVSPQDSGIDESPAPPEEKSEMSDAAGESFAVAAGGGGSAATAGPSGGSSASAKGSSAAGGSSGGGSGECRVRRSRLWQHSCDRQHSDCSEEGCLHGCCSRSLQTGKECDCSRECIGI